MTSDELRRAVELPARRAGIRVESSLAEALVAEIGDEPGGLPLLSTALVELWMARSDGWLKLEAHERLGGVRGAVARLADSSYENLDRRASAPPPAGSSCDWSAQGRRERSRGGGSSLGAGSGA